VLNENVDRSMRPCDLNTELEQFAIKGRGYESW